MAARFVSAVLLLFAASTAFSSEPLNNQTEILKDAAATLESDVAIFNSVDDPSQRCMYTTRPLYEPEKSLVVYALHYLDGSGGETEHTYCMGLNVTDDGYYPFGPCQDDGKINGVAQQFYFNGNNCYVTSIPLNGTYHCILFVKFEDKNSVPEECVTAFDNYCGPNRYTLYSKELCPQLN